MSRRLLTRNRIIGTALAVALLIAMIVNTKFLNPEELAAALPKPFNAQQIAGELFDRAQSELPTSAQPLADVVTAVQADPKAAATRFKAATPNESTFVFTVEATGTVTEATDASLRLNVPGIAEQTPILVPLSTAVNGTVLRDAMGFKFADAPGQTDYQRVGDELKKLVLAQVQDSVPDPVSLKGKKVKVVGVVSVPSGSPAPRAKPVNVQPVSIEEAS
jgi:predicted lipoprotein